MIGLNKNELLTAPWIVLALLLFFTVSIFVLHLMIQGIKEQYGTSISSTNQKRGKKEERLLSEIKRPKKNIDKSSFVKMNSKSIYVEEDN